MSNNPPPGATFQSKPVLEETKAAKGALAGYGVIFGAGAGVAHWMMSQTPAIIIAGVELLMLWGFTAAAIHYLYLVWDKETGSVPEPGEKKCHPWIAILGIAKVATFAGTGQYLVLGAVAAVGWIFIRPLIAAAAGITNLSAYPGLRADAMVMVSIGCALYLYTGYAQALERRTGTRLLKAMARLGTIGWIGSGAGAAGLFALVVLGYDYTGRIGALVMGMVAVLAGEPVLRLVGRYYQPAALRKRAAPVGDSIVLAVVFDSGKGATGLITDCEKLLGVKLGEVWVVQYLKQSVETIVLAGLVLGWASTCITAVPLGSRGVLVTFGRYSDKALEPGLHFTLPWPCQVVTPIETEKIREVSLGFDKDLTSPVLWTEKHVEGEKNLLVDNGEGLLAINVPIQYRIADAVAYLKTATDADTALRTLAERQMVQIAAYRESFHFMTDEREDIANKLRSALQAEADRYGLGLEITFVGLKDIHPPVPVAPAYQAVVSAQEQEEAMIDDALTYKEHTLPAANSQALGLTVAAQTGYVSRVDMAAGDAARFDALLATAQEAPKLLRVRLRYDMLEQTLLRPAKTIIPTPAGEYYLDLRGEGKGLPIP
jgi:regulator of protease activity HflC (stomatin/prohibitin superfamily)